MTGWRGWTGRAGWISRVGLSARARLGKLARRGRRERSEVRDSGRKAKVRKSSAAWQAGLSDLQYEVTRCGGTEPPFSGKYNHHHEAGIYTCICCGNELFSSDAKFDSDCGWPSFRRPLLPASVTEIKDISYGMVRTGVFCSRCEAHLGHVFAADPASAGRHYCINSAALGFSKPGDGPMLPDSAFFGNYTA